MDKAKIQQVKIFVDEFNKKITESDSLSSLIDTINQRTQPNGTITVTLDNDTKFNINAQTILNEIEGQKVIKDTELEDSIANIESVSSQVVSKKKIING